MPGLELMGPIAGCAQSPSSDPEVALEGVLRRGNGRRRVESLLRQQHPLAGVDTAGKPLERDVAQEKLRSEGDQRLGLQVLEG